MIKRGEITETISGQNDLKEDSTTLVQRFWLWRKRRLQQRFDAVLARQEKQRAIKGYESDCGNKAVRIIRGLRRCNWHLRIVE